VSGIETQPLQAATGRAVKLVDCDVHAQATEPMLTQYMSAGARRRLERYGHRSPRITDWYPRARNAGMRVDAWPDKPGHIWGSDPETTRAQLLDEFGIDYALLEVLSGADCYDDADLAAAWNQAINDWQLDKWLEFDDRFRSAICVPHEYPDLCVAEIGRRASDPRFMAVMMPASAMEPLGSRKYWPVYEAATAHGRPVVFHTGGYMDHRGAGYPSFYLEYHVANGINMQAQLTSMVCGGMFDAMPNLRVVLTECGLAWAAALCWSLNAGWELMREDLPRVKRRPSEYVRDHVWFTTQPIEEPAEPRHLLHTIEQAQLADRLLFATDYPHWDFDSPTQALPRAMPKQMREAIQCDNALALYGLPRERAIPEVK